MDFFLTRDAEMMLWTEVLLKGNAGIEQFLGGKIKKFSLPMNIDVCVKEDFMTEASEDNVSLLIINGNGLQPLYGNLLLATKDESGELSPLNGEQLKWIRDHQQHLYYCYGKYVTLLDLQATTKVVGGSLV